MGGSQDAPSRTDEEYAKLGIFPAKGRPSFEDLMGKPVESKPKLPSTGGLIHEVSTRGFFKSKCSNPKCYCNKKKLKKSILCKLGSHDMHQVKEGFSLHRCVRNNCGYEANMVNY